MKKITTEQAIKNATTCLADDIADLSTQRDGALSAFRSTASQLASINESLTSKMNDFNVLFNFIQEQQNATSKMIADNEAVRSRILEIIGE